MAAGGGRSRGVYSRPRKRTALACHRPSRCSRCAACSMKRMTSSVIFGTASRSTSPIRCARTTSEQPAQPPTAGQGPRGRYRKDEKAQPAGSSFPLLPWLLRCLSFLADRARILKLADSRCLVATVITTARGGGVLRLAFHCYFSSLASSHLHTAPRSVVTSLCALCLLPLAYCPVSCLLPTTPPCLFFSLCLFCFLFRRSSGGGWRGRAVWTYRPGRRPGVV